MTSNSIFYANNVENSPLTVSFRLLLALYSIIPLCITLKFFDEYWLQGSLLQSLPTRPENFLFFQILFGTPHIIASAIILTTNRDYMQLYKRRLAVMTLALAAIFGIGGYFLPYKLLYVAVASWTVFHVLKQQHGIARGLCKLPVWAFHILLWLSVFAGIFIYIGIFLKNSLDAQETAWIQYTAATLCILLAIATLACQRYVPSRFGLLFLWSNTLLVVSSLYLYLYKYYFLAILVPRLVHDATAYIFYITHDYNKHHLKPQNAVYRCAQYLKLNIFLVLPLLSFSLAFVLQAYGDVFFNIMTNALLGTEFRRAVTLGVLGYLGLMHYYSEGFTWKSGSPYRKYIAFSK